MTSVVYQTGINDWQRVQQDSYQNQVDYYKLWLDMVAKAKQYDELTKQPDCEDPTKAVILNKILQRLDEIEKKLNATP